MNSNYDETPDDELFEQIKELREVMLFPAIQNKEYVLKLITWQFNEKFKEFNRRREE